MIRNNSSRFNIKGVIFDFDDTLVDTEEWYYLADSATLKSFGVDLSREEKQLYTGISPHDFWQAFAERYKIGESIDSLIERTQSNYLSIAKKRIKLMPHMNGILEWFSENGYRMAIASGSSKRVLEELLKVLGISSIFSAIVSSEEVAKGKPAPDVFLEASKRLSIPPSELVVFEDSQFGVISAKAAGMCCIAIPSRANGALPQPFYSADLLFDKGRGEFSIERVAAELGLHCKKPLFKSGSSNELSLQIP
ncbi:MAG: HAD family phosphatase [Oligoflexales bacterium]|nr:HAD family phosphatase [Oligoflexales bacterium]